MRSVGSSAEQLERLIDDLLDLSRLQSGLIHPVLRTRSLDEVLPLAVAGHESDVVRLEVEEPAPLVTTDAGLLERVVANLVGNAVRHAPGVTGPGAGPRAAGDGRGDRGRPGPGHPARGTGARCSSRSSGSATAAPAASASGWPSPAGLTEALGGTLSAEDTPGGGLTMVLSLPRAVSATDAHAAAS